MILVKLMGGLGNQMFQYAFARCLSYKSKRKLIIDNETGFEDDFYGRRYALEVFNIKERIAQVDDIELFTKIKSSSKTFFDKFKKPKKIEIIDDDLTFKFHEELVRKYDNVYLRGFWQNENYFKPIEKIIHKEFTLKKELSANVKKYQKEIVSANSVALHIRRLLGYTNDKEKKNEEAVNFHGAVSLDYYKKAVEIIAEQVNNPHFFIFADDVEWAKEHIKLKYPNTFISGKDYEELILMSSCKHNVIPNSSFGWWGAWLNTNIEKIVIAPKNWFNKNSSEYKRWKIAEVDIVPKNWIKI